MKRELEQIAIQKCSDLPKQDKEYSNYVATAQVLNLKKSGKMLIIDVFKRKDSTLQLRFFSDGNSFLACKEWPARQWAKTLPSTLLESYAYGWDIDAMESDIKLAHKILKSGQESWHYVSGIKNEMDSFVRGIYRKKSMQAIERKYSKMEAHFKMFPDYPVDLDKFCEMNVFGYTYIFLSKIQKKKERDAVCGHCGHQFSVSKNVKPGQNGTCPECSMKARYRARWTPGYHGDIGKICIAHKAQDQLLIRWAKVTRTFNDAKCEYHFYDYFKNLYLHDPGGPVIYAYDYKSVMKWGSNWYRQKNGTVHHGESFVYASNLREVFGDTYYHVDLEAGLKNAGRLSFASLLNNLKDIPASEYLFKMGMPALAAGISRNKLGNGAGFTEVLGISKQYLPLYREFNVSPLEHRIIKASKSWVNESSFEKLRLLAPEFADCDDIEDILKTMSFERFVNYFSKQKAILSGKKKLTFYLTLYKDYLSMSKTLKVDMSRKSVRFPQNIKEAHDLLLPRFNKVKHKVDDEKFKQAVEKLYSGMQEYAKGDYHVKFPALRSDLITEGQALNHCVGADRYYENHIAGTKMIFFVRQANEPEKPFFTAEIDMRELKILQLYGFGDRSAPHEVRKFANEFLRTLKPISEKNRILVTVSA
jgi:hypothetical protein